MVPINNELQQALDDARFQAGVAVATTSASVALGAGPVVATAVGASGPAMVLLQKLSVRWLSNRQDRAARALTEAAKILGLDVEDLSRRAEGRPARLELLARVCEAAARTAMEHKVTALSHVLADGLRADDRLDDSIVMAAALADLEAPHVYLLNYLEDTPLPPPEMRPQGARELRGWETHQLARALPDLEGILDALVAILAGHGLIRTQADGTYGGLGSASTYAITTLGRRCLLLFGSEEIDAPQS